MALNKEYLVYKIINKRNKKIYIGVHVTCNINDNYMGSGRKIIKAIKEEGLENFEKIILYRFDNKKEMFKKEKELVNNEFIKRNDTYNVIIGGNGFNTIDTVTVVDKKGKTFRTHIDDPRYKNGELVPIAKGTIGVKDKNGKTFRVNVNDPRYKNGELIPIVTGLITVKNKDGKILRVSKNDPRFISGELVSYFKGKILVKDSSNNYLHIEKNDIRILSGEYKPFWKGRKHTEETKKKISESHKRNGTHKGERNSQYGTCWITNGIENKKIKKDNLQEWVKKGWKRGRQI